MKTLAQSAQEFIEYSKSSDSTITGSAVVNSLVERLAYSDVEELDEFIELMYGEDFLAFPVWLRMLAFRLACLLQPHSSKIRREAATDIRHFGPDWDSIADQLDQEADYLDQTLAEG